VLEVTICWICYISSLSSIIIRACLRIDAATGTLYAAGVIVTPVPYNAEWQIAEIDINPLARRCRAINSILFLHIEQFLSLILLLHGIVVKEASVSLPRPQLPSCETLSPVILLPSVVVEA